MITNFSIWNFLFRPFFNLFFSFLYMFLVFPKVSSRFQISKMGRKFVSFYRQLCWFALFISNWIAGFFLIETRPRYQLGIRYQRKCQMGRLLQITTKHCSRVRMGRIQKGLSGTSSFDFQNHWRLFSCWPRSQGNDWKRLCQTYPKHCFPRRKNQPSKTVTFLPPARYGMANWRWQVHHPSF